MIDVSKEQNVIERDVHCPYCQSDKAFLISGIAHKSTMLQWPEYGKKYWLCVIFTFGLYMLVHGFPLFEFKRVFTYQTYGFCPYCGKTYNAGVPQTVAKPKSPKVYRSEEQKLIFGLCGGIAEFTGLPVMLIRIGMVIYSILLLLIPVVIYFALCLLNIVTVNPRYTQKQ